MFRITDEKDGDYKIIYVLAGHPRLEHLRDLDQKPVTIGSLELDIGRCCPFSRPLVSTRTAVS
jgi:hypothetical protein